jgi:hypothetical protein
MPGEGILRTSRKIPAFMGPLYFYKNPTNPTFSTKNPTFGCEQDALMPAGRTPEAQSAVASSGYTPGENPRRSVLESQVFKPEQAESRTSSRGPRAGVCSICLKTG